jgi:hypothetical protein
MKATGCDSMGVLVGEIQSGLSINTLYSEVGQKMRTNIAIKYVSYEVCVPLQIHIR